MKRSPVFLSLVILMAFFVGCQDQQTIVELEELKARAVVEEQNKAIVEESIRAIDAQDFASLRRLWAEDVSIRSLDQPGPIGRDGTIEYIQTFYSAFPDNIHEIHQIIAGGDLVAVMLTNRATHQEDFAGIPVTGNAITVAGMHLVKVLDGAR